MAAGLSLYRIACLLVLVLAIQGGEAVKCQTSDGLTIFQVLQQTPNATVFTSLIQQANLIPTFNNKANQFTIFVPLDYAFGALLPLGKGYFDILPGIDIPRVMVNYHISVPPIPPKKMKGGLELTAGLRDPEGNLMTLNISNQADPLKPFVVEGAVNTANITRKIGKTPGIIACNSVIYLIDEVLLPSEDMVVKDDPPVSIRSVQRTASTFEPLVTLRDPDEEEEVLVLPSGPVLDEDPLLTDDDPLTEGDDPLLTDVEDDAAPSIKKKPGRGGRK